MARLDALTGRSLRTITDDPQGPFLQATVATTPATVNDDVYVLLDGFDEQRRIGPVLGWRTAPEASWPTRGDLALVVEVEQGNYWMLGWEPA